MTVTKRAARIAIGTTLVVVLAVALTVVGTPWWKGIARNTYTAYFANTNGLYTGDEVRILGVAVGTVEAIDPQPNAAKVTFSVDSQYPVPADAQAAILSPSLVSARAIQLVPAYSSGPKLADGATIPKERTAVPVEWDDLRAQLAKLTDSLQPTTPGGPSAVGELINSTAANLRGEGDTARETVIKLSKAVSALGDHSTDIFSTVWNLQVLVSALSSSSDLLAAFNTNLAEITTMLSNSPNEVANAAQGLDGAVKDLRGFVAENREGLGITFDHLNAITTALNDSKGDVKQVLHIAPTVFQNFMNIYQPAQSAVTGILAPVNFANTVQFICSAIQAASRENWEQSSRLCVQYLAPIIKNRQYNFPPLGINPFAGASARPNEITYSEDRLNPHLPPLAPPNAPAGLNDPAEPLAAEAAIGDLPPEAMSTDPSQGLQGLMVPPAPAPSGGTP
ncbi:MCE family protein [Mycolicibacterium moriokaense]|uniref:Phospholipid/cholesterol/gamma-HCH transport system substrate-binding protein n=1 Tax=Mycolicibacterium moriokaense TaxID=39691 RepID=A0A318HQR4_9MYCO|nr:MCE family protein [Mycolicibacterium moriokaense]PXX06872.1 phospholipid/cholesterol/gamma-HCH transport system substrate-binding protein [Mycolicibacterium moriokaense]